MVKKKALGKGLKALIDDDFLMKKERYALIDIDRIKENPLQPRKKFDEEKIKELASSIKERGVLQPIVVVKSNDDFLLVVGERRLRASKLAGLKKIPAIIREFEEKDLLINAVLENLQRENLNPVEISDALFEMNKKMNMTQEEIGKLLGIDRATVSNFIRLQNLAKEAKEALIAGKITLGHAKVLLQLENKDKEPSIVKEIISRKLSVRELEKLIKGEKKRKKGEKEEDLYFKALEDELKTYVGTGVKIKKKRKGGEIVFIFKNDDDLISFINKLKEK